MSLDEITPLKNHIAALEQALAATERDKNKEIARLQGDYQRSCNERGAITRAYENVIEILAEKLRG